MRKGRGMMEQEEWSQSEEQKQTGAEDEKKER